MRLEENDILELDRLRIWDFYLLFPSKVYEIRLGNDLKEIAKLRRRYITKGDNPYDTVHDGRKFLERLRPYQMGALTCLSSYGILNAQRLLNNEIEILNKEKLIELVKHVSELPTEEKNTLSWLCLFFKTFPMNGNNGFKSRTKLLISKYDGI
jgi:hypothetical protein